jgi:predicted acylesterase/phospholipase RssA
LFGKTALSDGIQLKQWLTDCVEQKLQADGILDRYGPHYKHLTFGRLGELAKKEKGYKHLYVFATNLSQEAITEFHSETSSRWQDIAVVDAVYASAALPGVFLPPTISHPSASDETQWVASQFVDGGLLANKPVDYFDKYRFQEPDIDQRWQGQHRTNRQTLALCLTTSSPNRVKPQTKSR